MESISGYKDTDREILLRLSDKDLLAVCKINKYFYNNVCDDNFFYRKLLTSYPNTLPYFTHSENIKTYKQYYLKVIYYVSELKAKFNYCYNSGNPQIQYQIFKTTNYDKNLCNNLLYEASTRGELELINEALKRGADLHSYAEYSLQIASAHGELEAVKYLVSLGADISAENHFALRWASTEGHLDVIKYLISLGTDIFPAIKAAVRSATIRGHLEVVKYLNSLEI